LNKTLKINGIKVNMKLKKHKLIIAFIGSVGAAVLVTALAIYLTPLKHLDLIPPTMNEVDPATFYADYAAHPDDYIFIDVRSADVYESAHAKGAINIPIENLYDEHYTLPHSGKQIALICTTGRLAAVAYGYLQDWGYTNLIHIQGGLENWTLEGLPVEGDNIANLASTTPSDEHQ
jgi:rhodanese-related sulfurtransferase